MFVLIILFYKQHVKINVNYSTNLNYMLIMCRIKVLKITIILINKFEYLWLTQTV